MLGLRAWGDDFVVVLFEFLDDEARAVLHGLAPRAALVHCRPGPCNARDALGAHGSRRELSRVHARHTAPFFAVFFFSCYCFFGGHFGSEVSCSGSMASATWAQNSFTCFLLFLVPVPSPDQQPSPPWSWHPSLEHDGGLCDVDQHIVSGFLQLQLSSQAMCGSFARVVDIENDELRVSAVHLPISFSPS